MASERGPWSLPTMLAVLAIDVVGIVLLVTYSAALGIALILLGGIITTAALMMQQARLARRPPD
jgi:hypothetical protein